MTDSPVVRVYATAQRPDHVNPWQANTPSDSTGSGVVVAAGQVLTGAHVVADATFLQVQKIAVPDKFVARVVGVCHDADLALLQIDDPTFMEGVEPAAIGELPHFQDHVAVVGFPVGGDEISITEGVVSRIEVQRYSHSQRELLAVTIDAAINSGNSGGPVLDEDGAVIGIAFQTLDDAENVGEMVPAPIISRFLAGVRDDRPAEVPGLGCRVQNLESPTLRESLGLAADQSGVLVQSVEYGSSTWGQLQAGDALLSIDGHAIANNGTIRYRERYRTSFDVVLGEHYLGERIPLTVQRGGERVELSVELKSHQLLVPLDRHDQRPSWFVFGGMVFQALTRDYLQTWDDWWDKAPVSLLHPYYYGNRTEAHHEAIVLTQVLADELNVGYESFEFTIVATVDGHVPVDLADFVRRVDGAEGRIEVAMTTGERIVMDAARAREAAPPILQRYRVPADRSTDLTNGVTAAP
jgi:S1-C subfamily serine protease